MRTQAGNSGKASPPRVPHRVSESLRYASETASVLVEKLDGTAAGLEHVLDGRAPEVHLLMRVDTLLVLLDQAIRLLGNLRAFIESSLHDGKLIGGGDHEAAGSDVRPRKPAANAGDNGSEQALPGEKEEDEAVSPQRADDSSEPQPSVTDASGSSAGDDEWGTKENSDEASALSRPPPEPNEGSGTNTSAEADSDFDFDFDFDGANAEPELTAEELVADLDASMEKITTDTEINPDELLNELWLNCGMFFCEVQARRTRVAKRRQAQDPRGMLEDGDAALRKAASALRSVLQATSRLLGTKVAPAHVLPEPAVELQGALAARRYLMILRSRFLGLTAGLNELSDDGVREAMRDARDLLDTCRAEPEFGGLRWPDRYAFSDFDRRMRTWTEEGGAAREARDVLRDLNVYADLLSEVNRRERLVEHDRRVRDRCVGYLRDLSSILSLTTADGWTRLAGILQDLKSIEGRSPRLDELVEHERGVGPGEAGSLQKRVDNLAEALLAVSI